MVQKLNPMQQEAVLCTEGPLLILAGAGSGKTRVLTNRVAYLISEKNVDPYHILAITFTNKAANEMRERVDQIAGEGGREVWVATFHSTCVRILRRFIDRLGYDSSFSIYDTDDSKVLMKNIMKSLNIDTTAVKEKNAMHVISSCKDKLQSPEDFKAEATDYREELIADIYLEYQRQMRKNNALDFDDLIVKTVELFEKCPEVLDYYQERFRYIMVDEYQDTNYAQFRLVELLAGKYHNICVVGDDDQSIYKFRGADIENILSFENAFAGAQVIKLEQNYRSTGNILSAANAVIAHNRGRKAKTLWTSRESGPKVRLFQYENAIDEADAIIRDVRANCTDGKFEDYAVLYRTNAQSRLLEERCVSMGVPYQLIGGVNFYQRKEIKDVLAYLKTINNGRDDLAAKRIINVPKRGIGATTIGKIDAAAAAEGISFYDMCRRAGNAKVDKFVELIEDFRAQLRKGSAGIADLIDKILNETGYREELEQEGEVEAQARIENIEELKSKAAEFESLQEFLEEVALVADVDGFDENASKMTLMTLHGAKGLEFPQVYMSGMEEGLFPSMMSINADDRGELEEERRICYVGITRAKDRLTMTFARSRMVNGETRWSKASRFVEEIPDEYLEKHVLDIGYLQDDPEDDYEYDSGYGRGRGGYGRGGYGDSGRGGYGRGGFGDSDRGYGSGGRAYRRPVEDFDYDEAPTRRPVGGSRDTGFGSGFGTGAGFSSSYGSGAGRNFDRSSFGSSAGSTRSNFGSSANSYGRSGSTGGFSGSKTSQLTRGSEIKKADKLDYEVGDRVRHIKFGDGTVLEIKDGERDYEVRVEFDDSGIKNMLAGFAKLEKLNN